MHRFGLVAIACLSLAAIAACGGSAGGAGDADVAQAAARVKGGFESMAAPAEALSTQTAATDAARDAAAKALGVPANQVTVDKLEAVQWSDSSLGCAEPGKVVPQAITPGLRIAFSAGGQRREVHTDNNGRIVVCQNPTQ
jgi:hypothetical protein